MSAAPAAQARTTIFYIGNWEWQEFPPGSDSLAWHPQFPADAWLDLRTYAESVDRPAAGSLQCCLLAVSDVPLGPGEWTQLATSVRGPLAVSLSTVENLFGYRSGSLTASTVGELAFDLLVDLADADGRKPLSPNRNQIWTLDLDGLRLFDESIDEHPAAWDDVLARIRADYGILRLRSQIDQSDLYLRYLATQANRYRIDYRDVLSDVYPDEGTVRPTTTHTESFDCADDLADITCDLTWTTTSGTHQIFSNEAYNNDTTSSRARAEADVSTDDHTTQADVSTLISTGDFAAIAVRFNSGGEDFYMCAVSNNNSFTWQIYEVNSGTRSTLAFNAEASPPGSGPFDMECEIDGSDIEMRIGGTPEETASDGTITGYTRGGLADNKSVAGRAKFNDWSITDLAATANRRTILID